MSLARCAIVGERDLASVSFRSILGSYDGESPCPAPAVEVMHLHSGHDLPVCAVHVDLFPAHALDLNKDRA